jgi:hypothetical protein
MTAPPVPTVAAQDAWYELVVGNVNPSAADTVPNVTYIQPTGDQPGLTGSLDGEIIYLAGTATVSMAVRSSSCGKRPVWPSRISSTYSTPGRFRLLAFPVDGSRPTSSKRSSSGQIITSGSVIDILPTNQLTTNILVNKTVGSPTTLNMPTLVAQWQEFVIIDGKGDASINPITISSPTIVINGGTSYVIASDGGTVRLTFDGAQFRIIG